MTSILGVFLRQRGCAALGALLPQPGIQHVFPRLHGRAIPGALLLPPASMRDVSRCSRRHPSWVTSCVSVGALPWVRYSRSLASGVSSRTSTGAQYLVRYSCRCLRIPAARVTADTSCVGDQVKTTSFGHESSFEDRSFTSSMKPPGHHHA